MPFDTALNSIWLALGVLALAATLRAHRSDRRPRGPAWLHICGVALIIAALFPYVSASDDVLRIERLDLKATSATPQLAHAGSPANANDHSRDALIRLYEIMDSPLGSSAHGFVFSFVFLSFVPILAFRSVSRPLNLVSGRSPPSGFGPIFSS